MREAPGVYAELTPNASHVKIFVYLDRIKFLATSVL